MGIRFGPFHLNTESGELLKDSRKVKIQQQPFQILVALLSRPGEVVTRDQLRRELWANDTFVDFEHGLNAAIKRLRDALGDSAEHPQYVETLARRGYRFIAEVQTNGVTPRAEAPTRPTTPARLAAPNSSRRRHLFQVAAVCCVLIGLAAFEKWPRRARTEVMPAPQPMRLVPFTTSPGAETEPAFSPDGRAIAFVGHEQQPGKANIYVKLIGSEQPLKLTNEVGGACCPVWSPDGRYIAFGGDQGIMLVPALGGPERKLLSEGMAAELGMSWSPDGKWLAKPGKNGNDPWSIFLFSLETHESRKISNPPANIIGDHRPAISPDGSQVAFRRINTPWSTDIYVQPLAGGVARRLTFEESFIHGLAWTADGKSIVYASNRAGGMRLWRVPATGGPSEALPVGGALAFHPAVAPVGNVLAFQQGGFHTVIWRVQISPVTGRAAAARKFIASTLGDGGPQYSPDGSKIAFHSARSGNGEVWICNAECTDPIQLTSMGVLTGSPRWSPDGTKIAMDVHQGGNSQIFVVSSDGGKPRQVTGGMYEHSVPGWSRDGRWIYFGSNRADGWQLWKVPAEGGDAVQVTKHGGFYAFESADGQTVYYTKESGPNIYQMPVQGGEERELVRADLASWGYWGPTNRGIYFIHKHNQLRFTIDFFNFATGRISQIAPVARPPYYEVGDFAVSPDGGSILYSQPEGEIDIMLVENFR